jgi:hypothetical protein
VACLSRKLSLCRCPPIEKDRRTITARRTPRHKRDEEEDAEMTLVTVLLSSLYVKKGHEPSFETPLRKKESGVAKFFYRARIDLR